jgi:diguanylate cyclase (GGDEF)-like protein
MHLSTSAGWPAEVQGPERPRAPLARRLQGRLRDWIGSRAEDELVFATGSSGDNTSPLIQAIIVAMGLLAVVSGIVDGSAGLGPLLGVAGFAAAFEAACYALERRNGRSWRLLVVKVAVYAVVIGAALWFLIASPGDVLYTRHPTVFLIYLLLITASGLRDDPRLPLVAGSFALISYSVIGACVPLLAEMSARGKAEALLRDFAWTPMIGHGLILFCTTLVAMASARRGQAVRRLSVRDGLTGLLNRRAFDTCLASEGERARRSGLPLSVAMIDVDLFKGLNDAYGHAFGDEVLRWIAQLLRQSFRSIDLVARYGGEEFAVVFVDAEARGLVERLDGLRVRVAATDLRPAGSAQPVRISISVGVASWPGDGADVEGALARADERLYQAKGAGRNRVVAGPASLDQQTA